MYGLQSPVRRIILLVLAVVTAGSAHAFSITTQGTWSYDPSVSSIYSGDETNVFSSSGFGSFPTPISLTWNSPDATFSTEIDTLSDGTSTLTLAMTQTSSFGLYNIDSTYTSMGTWVYVSGTGAFAGLSGSGDYTSDTSLTFIGNNGQLTGNSLHMVTGTLAPEPASVAMLGLGLFGLSRRRFVPLMKR